MPARKIFARESSRSHPPAAGAAAKDSASTTSAKVSHKAAQGSRAITGESSTYATPLNPQWLQFAMAVPPGVSPAQPQVGETSTPVPGMPQSGQTQTAQPEEQPQPHDQLTQAPASPEPQPESTQQNTQIALAPSVQESPQVKDNRSEQAQFRREHEGTPARAALQPVASSPGSEKPSEIPTPPLETEGSEAVSTEPEKTPVSPETTPEVQTTPEGGIELKPELAEGAEAKAKTEKAGEPTTPLKEATPEEGGAPAAPAAEGGEPQGGTEEEGASELEEQLAKADPQRATEDEADPADVAMGEPVEAASEPPVEPITEAISPAESPNLEDSVSTSDALATDESSDLGSESSPSIDTSGSSTPETMGEPIAEPPTEEAAEPVSAEGFSADEPALGGGAAEESRGTDLSAAEQKAALDTIGTSTGGGEAAVGGGGGGGGGAIPDSPKPEPPKVANAEPTAALAQVSNLPPDQLQTALGDVSAAVSKSAGDKRADLAANPLKMERPTGSPKNLHGAQTSEPATVGKQADKVEKVPEGQAIPTPEPEPLPEPPPSPAERIPEPAVAGGEGGELSEQEVTQLSSSVGDLPTQDPGLQVPYEPPPQVGLEGNADPAQADEQRQKLQGSVAETETEGRREVAQELGENTKIYPSVPPETLTAKVPAAGAANGAGQGAAPAAEGTADREALSIIAQKEKGGEIQAAVGKAQQEMAAKQEEYGTKVSEEKSKSNQEIAALETQSAADQAQARTQAQGAVKDKKGEWSTEQEKAVSTANKQADEKVAKGREEVQTKKKEADRQSTEHIQKGNREAETERRAAEKTAAEKKQEGQKESKGFFGWLASKAKAFFNKLKAAIKAAFDYARKKIKQAIEAAKKAAMAAIDLARNAIVSAIKAVGDALIAIGDKLLADFPVLRDKFRKAIQNTVDAAVKKVNEYADQLKKDVAAALDALAAGLDKLVGWLEKGMLAAVDAAAAVVDGAIKFAEKVAHAIGAFAALIKDVAAGPMKWLKNLGAAVVDGIKNHLWKAFKEAVQEWFNSKLEQVLGLGAMVWNLIKSGGLALAEVGKMAWEGIKSLIPPTLIRILVEKLVAMIVPAAGAIMAIIEGLQAAWGAIQRIIAAFQKFFAFLKAVKTGSAGPAFAVALAAAAIAVIDFVANWLIAKLAKGAAKIGGKIKGLAKKILGRKKGKAKGKKAKAKAKAPAKKAAKKKPEKKPTTAKKPTKTSDKKAAKKKDKEQKNRERLAKANRELPPKIDALLTKGTRGIVLRSRLLLWRAQYRLSALSISGKGKTFTIIARVNPSVSLGNGVRMDRDELLNFVRALAEEILSRKDVQEEADKVLATQGKTTTASGAEIQTLNVPKGTSVPAQVAADRRLPPLERGKHREITDENSDTRVRQVQSRLAEGREHQIIQEVSSEGKLISPKKYIEIANNMGVSGPDLALALLTFQRTGKVPEGFDISQVAGLQKLMFSQETLRSPAALLQSQMSIDLLAQGKSPQDIFGRNPKRGGLFPMSAEGAQARAKAVDQALGQRPEGEKLARVSRAERERQMRREVSLIRAWVKSLDIKFKTGASQQEKVEAIKAEIRNRMLRAFGLK